MKPTKITPTLTAALVFGLAHAALALDGTYNSQTGAWNVAGSWQGNIIANGTDNTAYFTNDVTAARTTSLGADRTIGHIVFTDADNSDGNGFNRTINNNILTFDVTSGRSTIDVTQSNRQLIFGSQISGNDGLSLIGPGLVRLNNANNDYSGGTEINAGTLFLAASGAAGSGTIYLGNTTGSSNVELRMVNTGTNISNAMEVRAGSSGVKTLANRSGNTVNYSGNITANDDLSILLAGATGGGVLTVSGASNSIAIGKTVSFDISGGGTGGITDSALWSGDGSVSYTSDAAKGFTISGAKTYSGGATLGSMSGTGIVVVQTSSDGPANAPTDGAFGTGTLTIGATRMRAVNSGDITIGNAITFADNPTFTTVGNEKSLIFTGNASLGATRTLTVEVGSTVADAFVEFSGEISGDGFGITKEGAGTLRLSGTNSYTGATVVSAGTLVVDGNISTSVSLTVEAGATLGGDGTLGAATISGSLAPGNSIGTVNAEGDVTWNSSSGNAWVFELGMASVDLAAASLGSDNDLLLIANGGDFLKGSGSAFTFDFAESGAVGWYKLVDWDGTTDFAATDFVATNLAAGLSGTFTVDSGTSALYLNVIPEPSAAVLLGLGGSLILLRRRVRS